jgi:hypothetical protein
MSFPLDTSMVLDLAGKQWLLKGKSLVAIADINEVNGPRVIVTDFGDALTRVETIAGVKQYAEAIIEKRLRDQGDTDGASKVLILDSESNSNTTRALYTAVSAEKFAQYWSFAKQHSDHCLLIPIAALMLRLAKSKGKGCHAAVMQYEQHVEMLITLNGHSYASLRVTSSSMANDDWQRAINYLAAEMQQVAVNCGREIDSVTWVDWNPELFEDAEQLGLPAKLSATLAMSVNPLTPKKLSHGKLQFSSGLPALLNMAKSTDAISSAVAKSLYYAERALPWVAGILLAASGALIASGIYWQNAAQNQQQQAVNLLSTVDSSALKLMQDKTAAFKQEFDSKQADDYVFISKLQSTIAMPSIAKMMSDVKQSMPEGVKVSLLALNNDKKDLASSPTGFIVEGRIFKPLAETNNDLEYISQQLTQRGYRVHENGVINKDNNHVFRLLLTIGK